MANSRKPAPAFLANKKLQGTQDIFEATVNMAVRATFQCLKPDTIYLRKIGENDITLKKC